MTNVVPDETRTKVTGRKQRNPLADVLFRLRKSPLAMFGLVVILILIVLALFADQLAPYSYSKQNLAHMFETPSRQFLLGTDEFGRDILSRLIYGAQVSPSSGIHCCGNRSGGGRISRGRLRVLWRMDRQQHHEDHGRTALHPQTLLAIAIAAALGPGLFNLMIAVGISAVPNYARIVRSSVLSIRSMEFIEAAKAVGSPDLRIILKHILPNSMAPIIVQSTLGVASAILNAAGLSFIGLGIRRPSQSGGHAFRRTSVYSRLSSYDAVSRSCHYDHHSCAELPRRRSARRPGPEAEALTGGRTTMTTNANNLLLDIRELTVHYVTDNGTVHAVEGLNLELRRGETLGLVGRRAQVNHHRTRNNAAIACSAWHSPRRSDTFRR